MSKVTPCLWFDDQAEQAAEFYTSLLPDSRIDSVDRWGEGGPVPTGTALMVFFTLDGRPYQALNGGPAFNFTEAFSLSVLVEDQAELDRLWDALVADGGEEGRCGWLKDRWGMSWQILPRALSELLGHPTRGQQVTEAFMQMGRISIADLRAAAGD